MCARAALRWQQLQALTQYSRLCRRRELAAFLATQPWGDKRRRYFLSRTEEYVGALRASLGIWSAATPRMRMSQMHVNFYATGSTALHLHICCADLACTRASGRVAIAVPEG